MKFHRRARTATLLVLVLLAGLPGVLFAACGPACPAAARSDMPCCHPAAVPSVRAASCCETVQAAAPTAASPALGPLSPAAFALAAPLALPTEPLIERPAPEPPAGPPPRHEGVGLYTLHSVFLI